MMEHECVKGGRTSIAMPGTNMITASPWKNLRRAFKPKVGTCLSAASRRSVATCVPFGRFGRAGRVGNVIPKVTPTPVDEATSLLGDGGEELAVEVAEGTSEIPGTIRKSPVVLLGQ